MSTIRLRFFAQLREQTGIGSLSVELKDAPSLVALKSHLLTTHPAWAPFFTSALLSAVNHQVVTGDARLHAGDEVAFFPPVTGG